jgi:phage-related minor tail protein
VKDNSSNELRALEQVIHQLYMQLELTQHKLSGIKRAFAEKEKVKDKKKVLPLYAHNLK